MSIRVLTPPGTGAIATVEVRGPEVWDVVLRLFRRANSKPLPEQPILHRHWYGRLGEGDTVVLALTQVEPETIVEVHCHGGRRVVQWVVDQFVDGLGEPGALATGGLRQTATPMASGNLRSLTLPARLIDDARSLLTKTRTIRTAGILLDQCHGAFDRALGIIAAEPTLSHIDSLLQFAPVGRHLVTPWTVVIAGAPNVGKSSLVNALAGYQRAVVSPVAGTTRDVVTTLCAFDGWPVELADTAGLRRAVTRLEAAGISLARDLLKAADLVVWVLDGANEPVFPDDPHALTVINKVDAPPAWDFARAAKALPVSAEAGTGIPDLIRAIVTHLVPVAPAPGAAVPHTDAQVAALVTARAALIAGNVDESRLHLETALRAVP